MDRGHWYGPQHACTIPPPPPGTGGRSWFPLAWIIIPAILLLFWSGPTIAAWASWPAPLQVSGEERLALAPGSHVYLDNAGHTRPESLLRDGQPDFLPVRATSFNLGIQPGVLWVAFALDDLDARPRLLTLDNPLFESVTLFILDQDGQWQTVPRHRAVDREGQLRPAWRHRFQIPAHTPASHCLLRVETIQSLRFHAEIQTHEGHQAQATGLWLAQGAYHGIILAMALYNLFLLITLRDTNYAWYIGFVLSTAGYFLFQRGLHLELLPTVTPQTTHLLMFLCLALLSVFVLGFCRRFLLTRQRDPVWDRWLLLAKGLPVIGILLHLMDASFSVLFFSLSLLLIIVLVIGVTVRSLWRHRFRPALYLLLAWAVMILGALLFILAALGLQPNTTLTYYAIQVGSALEVIMMSLALAWRIRVLQAEREALARRGMHLERVSQTDALTGLYNRRHLERLLPEAVATAHQRSAPLSLVIIDADNFKQINDTHGHQQGDQVLIRMAHVLADTVRRGDTVCRYGGEEFVALLPGADDTTGRQIAERLRQAVARMPSPLDEDMATHTVSIGLATLRPGERAEDLFLRADRALYVAKTGGKDRVKVG
ncbi:diguanylate cyclase (GGDEF) domain-containing protein [Ectothiorhodospira magna]|uniref:diguanylate cyclase n=1 Tax=Ectothiorhodospira magna TaxID=867345 RepID=A0A1H9C278_9GAMM|nr:diguanylate cyclase [Ectothiorhodospira magna]SEP95242.1 diguanylate cyclase (GGDEF) domain-containing protein [Ectothiorhodospira magna]